MRTIHIADETLLFSESLTFKEKLEVAVALDQMNVQTIELNAPSKMQDTLLYRAMAATAKNAALSVRVALSEEGVEAAYRSVAEAQNKRLTVCVPLSLMRMEYVLKQKPKNVPALIERIVSKCAETGAPVAFMAEDATRADEELLIQAVQTAIRAGASTVIFCDSAAQLLPEEFACFIGDMKKKAPELSGVKIGVSCANDMSLALPNALAAVKAGADEVTTAIGQAAHPSPTAMNRVIEKRGAALGAELALNAAQLNMLRGKIKNILAAPKNEYTPFETGVRPAAEGGAMTAQSDLASVSAATKKLGYDLSADDRQKVFDAFRAIAEKKPVTLAELDAIIASVAMQAPARYKLKSYVINTGDVITATAHVKLTKDGGEVEGISLGDGPIDAAFLAIEKIIGHHFELDDFKIQSVTEGREAVGDALVRLRAFGKLYAGRGISTDIIGASIRAYLSALNKIVYDEVNAQ